MKKEYTFLHPKTFVTLTDNSVTISRGAHNYMVNRGMRGNHTIPYNNIVEIKYKKASVLSKGYIQFTTAQSQVLGALRTLNQPQNAIKFGKASNKTILEIKNLVEQKIGNHRSMQKVDELKEYKALLDQGIITQDDFERKKNELLDL